MRLRQGTTQPIILKLIDWVIFMISRFLKYVIYIKQMYASKFHTLLQCLKRVCSSKVESITSFSMVKLFGMP